MRDGQEEVQGRTWNQGLSRACCCSSVSGLPKAFLAMCNKLVCFQPKGVTSVQTGWQSWGCRGEGWPESLPSQLLERGPGRGVGVEGRRTKAALVLPDTFLASFESPAAFRNFTEEKRAAPGRRLRSRRSATGVGCRWAGAGVVCPLSFCMALEWLAQSFPL